MSEAGEWRLGAVEAAFLEATGRLAGQGLASEMNLLSGVLRSELAEWRVMGLALEVFDGEPALLPAADEQVADAFASYADLSVAAGAEWSERLDSADAFQEALTSALEDLRDERLELVRLMTMASTDERTARLAEVHEVARVIEESGLSVDIPVQRISWALSGRETAIDEARPGPAAWRSQEAVERADDFDLLNEAGGRLAAAVLTAELGDSVNRDEITEAIDAEKRGLGRGMNA